VDILGIVQPAHAADAAVRRQARVDFGISMRLNVISTYR
jgi:hypothetical protein